MEERGQPSYDHHLNHTSSPNSQTLTHSHQDHIQPIFESGTYVVLVPKNQVFSKPSHENRLPIPHDDGLQQDGPRRICCGCGSSRCCIFLISIVLIAGIIGVFVSVFLTIDDPGFHIEHVICKTSSSSTTPEFDVRIKVENPNKHKVISYNQKDSNVTLSFKQKEIAQGKFPIFDQDPKNTTILGVVLHASKLPEEIRTSMNRTKSKISIPLYLSMNIGMQFKFVEMNLHRKKIDVSCSLTVDRLDKDSQILSQDCGTN